jgi:hypothetical protein
VLILNIIYFASTYGRHGCDRVTAIANEGGFACVPCALKSQSLRWHHGHEPDVGETAKLRAMLAVLK